MRKFNINVNGKAYQVEVEEVGGSTAFVPQSASVPVGEPQTAPTPTPAPVAVAPADATIISAPMPGTILNINVAVGDSIKAGDTLLILEAMKMENEILSPKAGTIATIQAVKGSSVNAGDILISIS